MEEGIVGISLSGTMLPVDELLPEGNLGLVVPEMLRPSAMSC